jgi:hypothetical protein
MAEKAAEAKLKASLAGFTSRRAQAGDFVASIRQNAVSQEQHMAAQRAAEAAAASRRRAEASVPLGLQVSVLAEGAGGQRRTEGGAWL